MKKVIASTLSTISFLSLALPVFADTNIPLCPTGSGQFGKLCNTSVDFGTIVRTIIIILLVAAVVLSLIFLIIGGIKWILSGGDKGGVEAARNQIIGALIGLAVSFAAFFILNIVLQIFLGQTLQSVTLPTLGL